MPYAGHVRAPFIVLKVYDQKEILGRSCLTRNTFIELSALSKPGTKREAHTALVYFALLEKQAMFLRGVQLDLLEKVTVKPAGSYMSEPFCHARKW